MITEVKQIDVENGGRFLVFTKCRKVGELRNSGIILPGLKNRSVSNFSVCQCKVGLPLSLHYTNSDGHTTIGTTSSVISQILRVS